MIDFAAYSLTLEDVPVTITAGTRLGHYEILAPLGKGGMGEVYLALDTKLRRKVALKLLGEELASHPDRFRRFTQEAEAAAALSHPNVTHIYEVNQQDGVNFIAMEYVQGETLRRHMAHGRVPLREALDTSIQVASALAAAHQAGVVHRDIKPENIIIRPDGYVKVLDFGLAKLVDLPAVSSDTESPTVVKANTDPGTVLGTVNYMSPEQARGKPVDARSDIFSLGVVIYEMLTGRAPFVGETPSDVIAALLEREPPPIASLAPNAPADLRHIVNKALRKDREERYQSVKSLLADLKALRRELELATDLERSISPEATSGRGGTPGAVVAALAEAEESDGLDLAHVLFCDIIGYSLLPIDQQTQMMRRLQEIVRQTEAYRRAEASHQLVRLPAGDGMALAFLYDLSAPVRCAFDIARALKAYPDIRLRIGVHTGPVFRSADINANRKVVGSGINLAQRVMDCGDAGHILVSRNVAEVLSEVSQWQAYLHDLGEVEVKHGVRLHISNLYDDEIGNAETPAKVKSQRAASAPPDTTPTTGSVVSEIKQHKRGIAVALLVVLLAAIGLASWFFFLRLPHVRQFESIAVMPFVNESGNPDVEYLSDGMTETLISRLSQLPQLKVKARSSVFRYKGKNTNPQTIGKELNVQAILNGRVVQRGDQLTLSLELMDAVTEDVIWSEQYNRKQTDLVSLQSEIARDVSSKLKTKLSGADEAKVTKKYTANPEAYQLYLKGRFQWNKRTGESLRQADELYKQAIENDPNYALAYAGLAETYVLFPQSSVASPRDSLPQAKAAALRALELDDSLDEAHAALGLYLSAFAWNHPAAEKELRRAIEINPNNATAYHWLGIVLAFTMGRFDEAIAASNRAEELDPLSPIISADSGFNLFAARRYDDAIAQIKRTLTLDPNFYYARYVIGASYHAEGMYSEAIVEYRKAHELDDDPLVTALLARSLAKSGGRGEAAKLRDQLRAESAHRYVPNVAFALVYAALDDRDEAFKWLEKDFVERSYFPSLYAVDPRLDDLRDDPRFADLLRRVELAKMD